MRLRKCLDHFQVFLNDRFVDLCQGARLAECFDMVRDRLQWEISIITLSNRTVLCTIGSSSGFRDFVLGNGTNEPLLP